MQKKLRTIWKLGLALVALVPSVAALAELQTQTVAPVADTYIEEDAPFQDPVSNVNFGTATELRLRGLVRLRRTLLRFEGFEPVIPAGSFASVVSAVIELNPVSTNWLDVFVGGDLSLHTVLEDWTETGATWNCGDDPFAGQLLPFPGCAQPWLGGNFEPTAADVIHLDFFNTAIQFDVTDEVLAILNGGANRGWLVKLVDETKSEEVVMDSREATTGVAPKLVVTYDILPDTAPPVFELLEPIAGGFEIRGLRPDLTLQLSEGGSGLGTDLAILLDGVDITAGCVESQPPPPPPPPGGGDGDGQTAGGVEPMAAASVSSLAGAAKTGTFLYTCTPPSDLAAGGHLLEASVSDLAGNVGSLSAPFELLLGTGPHVFELTAAADATILAESDLENRGLTATLEVQDTPVHRALVEFDLAAFEDLVAKTTVTFDQAVLDLFVEGTANLSAARTVAPFRVTEKWLEDEVTWSCAFGGSPAGECPRPWIGGNTAASAESTASVDAATSGVLSWTVTNDLAGGLLPAGAPLNPLFGWLLRFDPETGTPASPTPPTVTFTSREGLAAQAPRLVVTFSTPDAPDVVPPEVVFNAPGATTTNPSPAVSLTFSDDNSGVDAASFVLTLDGLDITANCIVTVTGADCTTPALADGSHTLSATLADVAGNSVTVDHTFQVLADTGPPVITLASPSAIVYNDTAPTIEVAYSDDTSVDTSTLVLTLDGADLLPGCTVGAASAVCTPPTLTAGSHTLVATIADTAGQFTTETFTFEIVLDTTAPTLAITAPTGTVYNDTTPAVTVSFSDDNAGVDAASLDVQVDGVSIVGSCVVDEVAGTAICEPGALLAGTHAVAASLVDLAGNAATASGSFDLVIDTTVPTLAITAPTGTVVGDTTPAVTVTFSDAGSGVDTATLRVRVDGFDISASCVLGIGTATCEPPALGEGGHTTTAEIADLAGNVATASQLFTVNLNLTDTVPPSLAITSPPALVSNDPDPAITVTYSDAESDVDLTTLRIAVDGFELVTDGRCVVGAASATCTPPLLGAGTHGVTADIADLAGNPATASTSFNLSFTIGDTVAPVVAITEPADTVVFDDLTPQITVTYSDADSGVAILTLAVDVDGTDITAGCVLGDVSTVCEPPPLTIGTHVVTATVQDLLGNLGTASFGFDIALTTPDLTPPVIAIAEPSTTPLGVDVTPIRVTYADGETGVDLSSLVINLDLTDVTATCDVGPTEATCTSPILAEGSHTVAASIQDLAGNPASASFAFEVVPAGDSTPPQITITAPGDRVVNDTTPEVVVEYADPESGVVPSSLEVLVDGVSATASCTTTLTSARCESPVLGAGTHTAVARIQNGQGTLAETSKTFEVVLSQNAPLLSITSPLAGQTLSTPSFIVSLVYSDADGDLDLTSLIVRLNGLGITDRCTVTSTAADCQTPPLQDGAHTVQAEISDALGNRTSASVSFIVASPEVDNTPPSLTLTSPADQVQDDSTPAIEAQYSDLETGVDITSLVVRLEGVPLDTCVVGDLMATCEPPPLQTGFYTVDAEIRDLKGNVASASKTFEIVVTTADTTAPTVTIVQPASTQILDDTSPQLIVQYSDIGLGIDLTSVKVFVDTSSSACTVGADTAVCEPPELNGGAHTVLAEVEDLAGNVAQAEATFEILFSVGEQTPPDLIITSPAGSQFIVEGVPDFQAVFSDSDSGLDLATLHVELDLLDVTATCQTGATGTTCPTPALLPGMHSWSVEIADVAGNVATAQAVFDVRLDDIPPALVIEAPGLLVRGDTTPQILISYSDSHSGVDLGSLQVLLNGSVLSGCLAQTAGASCEAPTLAAGPHVLQVSVADLQGNISARTLEFDLELALEVAIESPITGFLTSSETADLSGTASLEAATVSVGEVAGTVGNGVFTVLDVPLREGTNTLTVVARTPDGGIGSATVMVVRDTTAPSVVIQSPPNAFLTTASQILVTGEYNEPASSGSELADAVVTVNGVPAAVEHRTFVLEDHLLQPGENTVRVEATDAAGNVGSAEVTVTLLTNPVQKIEELLGNGQSGTVGETLSKPLVVRVTDGIGNPLAERQVRFEVTRGDGLVSSAAEQGRALTVRTDSLGRAQADFTLGERSGMGNHEVTVTSVGFPGSLVFCASAEPLPAQRIVRIQGNVQTGTLAAAVGEELPKPLYTQVFDAMKNPVAGVPVTYEVVTGGGSFEGAPTSTTETDSNGVATATFRLGPVPGIDVNVVKASIPNGTGGPTVFNITGLVPGPEELTSISGLVLDNQDLPVPNVTVSVRDTALSAITDAEGRFQISGAPVGTVHLVADGTTTTLVGTWPVLEFEMVTVSGQDNELGMPIRLLPIDPGVLVGGDVDVEIPLEGVPGASLTVFAHSVTFPDGSTEGLVSFTQVHNDKVPMVPPLGSIFAVALTIQPTGALFDPPARIQIPNPGHKPGEVVDIYSFDHDLGEFVPAGTASVTADGLFLRSNPGFGVRKAGWHGCVQPVPETDACGPGVPGACTLCTSQGPAPRCDECSICTGGGGAVVTGDGQILAAATSPCAPLTIDRLEVKIEGDPMDPLFGKEQEIQFQADIDTNCPDPTFEWDFGDMEMGTGEMPTHSYKKAGTFNVTVTARCGTCSTLERTSLPMTVEVLDLVDASFKMIDMETAMDLEEEDRDGDGNDDIFFRVLGGVRLKLAIPSTSPVRSNIQNINWSASGGHFFNGFETTALGLTSLGVQGPDKVEVFWEGGWQIDRDDVITTTVTLNDGHEVVDMNHIVTRELNDTVSIGDDVRMLQSLLRLTGVAQGNTPGVLGTAVVVDGDFGPSTKRAVQRFEFRSDAFTCARPVQLTCIQMSGTGVVDNDLLTRLEEVWVDYQTAQEKFPMDRAIRTNHPQFNNWADTASTELQKTYTTASHNTVAPAVMYPEIIKAWVRKEAIYGHWGRSVDFRITLGSADELGSIGFSQILHTHKYGTGNITSIENLNLYHPEENMKGLAVFSNDGTTPSTSNGGGGFHFAFSTMDYQATINYMSYPRVGLSYTDDLKDLLSKGIMAYNRGSGLAAFRTTVWPEFLKTFDPPTATTGFGTRTAMRYTLEIQQNAGLTLRCWMWTEQAITTGGNDVCDTAPAAGDVLRPVMPGLNNQTCIVAAPGQPLATAVATPDDNLVEFTWEYCETNWLANQSWATVRQMSIPMQIP